MKANQSQIDTFNQELAEDLESKIMKEREWYARKAANAVKYGLLDQTVKHHLKNLSILCDKAKSKNARTFHAVTCSCTIYWVATEAEGGMHNTVTCPDCLALKPS